MVDRIAASNGRVAHIVVDRVGEDVVTLCGKTLVESDVTVNNELDHCKQCDKKFEE